MAVIMFFKSLLKNYLGFIFGLILGSSVATITTITILYDPSSLAEIANVQACLIDELNK